MFGSILTSLKSPQLLCVLNGLLKINGNAYRRRDVGFNLYVLKNYISTKEEQRKHQCHAATSSSYQDGVQYSLNLWFDLSLQY